MRLPTLYHVVVIPAAVLFTVLALGFLRYTSRVEAQELRFRLNTLSVRGAYADASDLLIRLKSEQAQNARADFKTQEDEFALLAAFSERPAFSPAFDSAPLARLYHALIAALQRLAGIRPAQHLYLESGPDVLTLAYNLERRRLFSEALVTFQKGLTTANTPQTRDFILLHSGYCLFFLSDYDAAEKAWRSVRENPAHETNRQLAEKLLVWLAEFRKGRQTAAKKTNGKARAVEYYRILAYKESLETLLKVGERERDAGYYLLRGRVKEAPGDFAGAVEDFTKVFTARGAAGVALAANRRLYTMATAYRPDTRLAEAAKQKGIAGGDADFYASVAAFSASPSVPITGSYADEKAYRLLLSTTSDKILQKDAKTKRVIRTWRIKTTNGSVITGREISAGAVIVLENENGRFRIPVADIESKEIVSGN